MTIRDRIFDKKRVTGTQNSQFALEKQGDAYV